MNELTRYANHRCSEPVALRKSNPRIHMDATTRAIYLWRTRGNSILLDRLDLGFLKDSNPPPRAIQTNCNTFKMGRLCRQHQAELDAQTSGRS
jgi:hypothetical protein